MRRNRGFLNLHFQKLAYRLDGEKGQDMEQKIYNAGFEIMDMVKTSESGGYAWGRSKTQYVTWGYRTDRNGEVDFYHGHYFPRDPDAPARANAACRADFYERLSNAFGQYAKYGF